MTNAQVPMLDQQGNAGMVDADKVQAATASGFKPAVKMVGPDGSPGYVSQDKVDAARQSNFAVAPDHPGAQKMVTPDGKITYALPNEVQQFESSGHTKIATDGRFEVKPLPGEDSTATMQRAVNVGRALGPQQMQQSMQAEKNWWTSKEGMKDEAAGLVNVAGAGVETAAALVGGSEAGVGAKAGLSALGETETMQLIKSSPRLYAEWVLKHPALKEAAVKAAVKVGTGAASAIGAGGAYAAYKWLSKVTE
jgi:hypothetical protein